MQTDDTLNWTCQYCGVENTVWIDLTEDCRICCRPNRIIVVHDFEDNITIEARPADE